MNTTYTRWRDGEPRRGRQFPSLDITHPAYRARCVLCGYSLGSDPYGGVQLVALGPDDDDTRERHHTGRWYAALAVLVHTACLRDLTDTRLDEIVAELQPTAP